jgi:hypothetical protein
VIDTEFYTTSVLFIDGNDADRTHFARKLKECSSDYAILEAPDGDSGLALYRSQRIDCVILELNFLRSIRLRGFSTFGSDSSQATRRRYCSYEERLSRFMGLSQSEWGLCLPA